MKRKSWIAAIVLACPVAGGIARAQGAATQTAPPPPPPAMQPAMRVISPEVSPDHRIVFRILAPQAKTVGLRASDIQGLPREGGAALHRQDDNLRLGRLGADSRDQLQPRFPRHVEIEHQHIRMVPAHEPRRIRGVPRFGDDLEARLGVQQHP